MPNQSGTLRCKYCNDTFQRNGHLQRHLLRHSGLKPFSCSVCRKSFSRNDTLLRHEAIHGPHDAQLDNNRSVARSCAPCVQAKQRCYGGVPCARCERRHFICKYSGEQRRSSISSTPRSSNRIPNGPLPENIAVQDHPALQVPFPTVPLPSSVSIGSASQASVTSPPNRSSVTTSMSNSLAEETNLESWRGLFITPDSISMTESDGFADYFPHDMSYTDAISRSLGFPFVCMTQSLDIPSQAAYNLDQGLSNPCMPNDGSLAIVESTGSANRMGSGTDSCTTIDSNEVSTRADPNATCAPPTDACPPFPVLQEEELQIAGAELFGHVSKIPEPSYNRLRDFYISERGYYDNESFPPTRLLHAFVELYFEYFDPYLPFLHPMRVGSDDLSWILLTAVAAIGSQYSDVRDAPAFAVVLQNLLRRATHPKNLQNTAQKPDLALVQSVLLRIVGLMFSGSVVEQTLFQQEKSILITLCRGLKTPTDFNDSNESANDQDSDDAWLSWLRGEEVVRLVHCVHIIECFQLIFFDLRPLFRLTDFTQRLPYNSNAWECCNTRHWSRENQTGYPDSKMRHDGSFSTRSNILSLYADERAILDSMQSSRRLRALIRSEPGNGLPGQDTYSARRKLLSLGALEDDIAFLDAVIDDAIAPESQSIPGMGYNGQDPMLHVVAILRDIPLRLIYASVGWQANDTEMQGSRERLKVYLQRNQSTARTCLWHASRIYSSVQSVHHPAYYSSLTLAIAVSYILLYDQLVQFPAPQGNLLRLDKVIEKPGIEAWASCVQDFRVHITGIGILDNSESSRRLLVNAEKILRSQRSWQSIARAVADCFLQMSKGQKPKIN